MTNGAAGSGGPPTSYPSGPSAGPTARRMSYASVASGVAPPFHSIPARSGTFSHLASSTPSNSYPPQYPEHRYPRPQSGHELEMNTNGSVPFGSTWRKSVPLPSYSRQFANVPGYGSISSVSTNSFFIPSYLRHSRYVAKLEVAHKARLAAQRESTSAPSSNPPSLSTSASNVNILRMAPSHRGMTFDIIESNPPKEDDQLMPLPSRFSDVEKYRELDLANDGLDVRYNGATSKAEMEAAAVRADYPMSPQCGIYYFEVEMKSKTSDAMVAVGFSTQKASLERLPGWETESWAYHGDDGKTFCGENHGRVYGQPFKTGDVIGCGINFYTGQAFFTKNGNDLGTAFRELKNVRPFPAVGMKKHTGSQVTINFGQRPFVFDIDDMMAKQQKLIQLEIARTKVTTLYPPLDEGSLIEELVAHFLAHDGYVETAKAFSAQVREEKKALSTTQGTSTPDITTQADFDAMNRQKIRASILEGDIDKALKHTNMYYPQALAENPQTVFRLKCRKWVELIRRSNELNHQPVERNGKATSNGRSKIAVDDVFDQDMELDEQSNGTDEWERMDTEETENAMESQELLREAMEYGQVLMREYGTDRYKRTLDDIFSLIAYDDAKMSVHGHLLDPAGRVVVAEELNSAILVSLGRSSSAALERLYRQTEVLITELSQDGGPAAFVNLQNPVQI